MYLSSPLSTGGTGRQKEKMQRRNEALLAKNIKLKEKVKELEEKKNEFSNFCQESIKNLSDMKKVNAEKEDLLKSEIKKMNLLLREKEKLSTLVSHLKAQKKEGLEALKIDRMRQFVENSASDIKEQEEILQKIEAKAKTPQKQIPVRQRESAIIDREINTQSLPQITEISFEIDKKVPNLATSEAVIYDLPESTYELAGLQCIPGDPYYIPICENTKLKEKAKEKFKQALSLIGTAQIYKEDLESLNSELVRTSTTVSIATTKKISYMGRERNIEYLEHTKSRRMDSINQLNSTIDHYTNDLNNGMKKLVDVEHSIQVTREQIGKLQRRETPDVPHLVTEMKKCKKLFNERTKKLKQVTSKIPEVDKEIQLLEKMFHPNLLDRMSSEIETVRYEKRMLQVQLADIQKINQSEIKEQATKSEKMLQELEETVNSLVFALGKIKQHKKNIEQTIEYTQAAITGAGLTVPPMKEKKNRVTF